jgi:hypothetical protein
VSAAEPYPETERTRVYRKPGRGSYDRELVHSILDEGQPLAEGARGRSPLPRAR